MKKWVLLFAVAFSWIFLHAQTVQWTWVSGDSVGNKLDVYGNKRVLDPANKPFIVQLKVPQYLTNQTTWKK